LLWLHPTPTTEYTRLKSVRYGTIMIAQAQALIAFFLYAKRKRWKKFFSFGFDMQKLSRTMRRNHIKYVLGALGQFHQTSRDGDALKMPIRLKQTSRNQKKKWPKLHKKNFQVLYASGMRNKQDHVAGYKKFNKQNRTITRDREPAFLETPYHKRSCSGNQINYLVSAKENKSQKNIGFRVGLIADARTWRQCCRQQRNNWWLKIFFMAEFALILLWANKLIKTTNKFFFGLWGVRLQF